MFLWALLSLSSLCTFGQEQDGQGLATPVLGSGFNGQMGDGLPPLATAVGQFITHALSPSGQRFYYSDGSTNKLRVATGTAAGGSVQVFLGASRGTGNPYTPDGNMSVTNVNVPLGLAVAPTNNADLFYVDCGKAVFLACFLRLANVSTGLVTTLAGGNSTTSTCTAPWLGDGAAAGRNASCLANPNQIALDWPRQMVYISDTSNNRIRALNLTTGIITTIVGGGLSSTVASGVTRPTAVLLNNPTGVAVSGLGDLYVSDSNNNRILAVLAANTSAVVLVAGQGGVGYTGDGGAATAAKLNKPGNMVVSPGSRSLLFWDTGNDALRRVNLTSGNISTIMGGVAYPGAPPGSPARSMLLLRNAGVAFNSSSGEVVVSDRTLNTAWAIGASPAAAPSPSPTPSALPATPWAPPCPPQALTASLGTFSGQGASGATQVYSVTAFVADGPWWATTFYPTQGLCTATSSSSSSSLYVLTSGGATVGATVRALSLANGSTATLLPTTPLTVQPPAGYADGSSSAARLGGQFPRACAQAPVEAGSSSSPPPLSFWRMLGTG